MSLTIERRAIHLLRQMARWKSDDAWRMRIQKRTVQADRLQQISNACHAGAEALDSCCAVCQHDTEYAECKLNWRRPIVGVYWKERNACSQFVRVEKGSGQ